MARSDSPAVALTVLTGLNLLNYIDRYLGAAILPLITADLALTDTQAGLLLTVFILAYALISPAVGWLGDRRSRYPIAAAGVIVWSAATFGSGLAPTFALLLFSRALIGVGEASYSVVTPSLIADYYPPGLRARALSFFYAAIPLGSALGYIIGGQVGEHLGWRWAFFLAGAPGALLGLALFLLREPTRGAQDRSPSGRPSVPLSLRASLAALTRRRSYLFNTGAQTIYTFAIGGLAGWMPTYFVRERQLSLQAADFTFGVVLCLAGFGGTLVGGYFGDSLARRIRGAHFLMSGWALIASLPFTVLAILSPVPAIFWPSMFVTLFLLFLNTGPLNAALANVLPAELRARGFALYTLCIHLLGDAASPTLIGLASDRIGLKWPVLTTGLLLGLSGLVLLAGRRALERDLEASA
jgi:MFS family permease